MLPDLGALRLGPDGPSAPRRAASTGTVWNLDDDPYSNEVKEYRHGGTYKPSEMWAQLMQRIDPVSLETLDSDLINDPPLIVTPTGFIMLKSTYDQLFRRGDFRNPENRDESLYGIPGGINAGTPAQQILFNPNGTPQVANGRIVTQDYTPAAPPPAQPAPAAPGGAGGQQALAAQLGQELRTVTDRRYDFVFFSQTEAERLSESKRLARNRTGNCHGNINTILELLSHDHLLRGPDRVRAALALLERTVVGVPNSYSTPLWTARSALQQRLPGLPNVNAVDDLAEQPFDFALANVSVGVVTTLLSNVLTGRALQAGIEWDSVKSVFMNKLTSRTSPNTMFFTNQPVINIGRIARYLRARKVEVDDVFSRARRMHAEATTDLQMPDPDGTVSRRNILKIHKIVFDANAAAAGAHVAIALHYTARAMAVTQHGSRTLSVGWSIQPIGDLNDLQETLIGISIRRLALGRLLAAPPGELPDVGLTRATFASFGAASTFLADYTGLRRTFDDMVGVRIVDDGSFEFSVGAPLPGSELWRDAGPALREFWDLRTNLSMLWHQRIAPTFMYQTWFTHPQGVTSMDPAQLNHRVRTNPSLSDHVSARRQQDYLWRLESFDALDQMAMCNYLTDIGLGGYALPLSSDTETQLKPLFKHVWAVYLVAEKTKRYAEAAIDYILAHSSEAERRQFLNNTVDSVDTDATPEQETAWRERLMHHLLSVHRIDIPKYLQRLFADTVVGSVFAHYHLGDGDPWSQLAARLRSASNSDPLPWRTDLPPDMMHNRVHTWTENISAIKIKLRQQNVLIAEVLRCYFDLTNDSAGEMVSDETMRNVWRPLNIAVNEATRLVRARTGVLPEQAYGF